MTQQAGSCELLGRRGWQKAIMYSGDASWASPPVNPFIICHLWISERIPQAALSSADWCLFKIFRTFLELYLRCKCGSPPPPPPVRPSASQNQHLVEEGTVSPGVCLPAPSATWLENARMLKKVAVWGKWLWSWMSEHQRLLLWLLFYFSYLPTSWLTWNQLS